MHDNDGGHRLLFAHPRMVESLIREFVPEEWVEQLDFRTLERVNASYVSGGRRRWRRREGDMAWRVQNREGAPVYLYLLIEFQSTVDRFMAVRMMDYQALLYQDMIARGELTPDGGLPLVILLVVYNGNRDWSGPTRLSDLIRPGFPGAEAHRPELRYRVIAENAFAPEELELRGGLVPLLFWLGMQVPGTLREMPPRLREILAEEDDPSLTRAFLLWLGHLLGQSNRGIRKRLSLEDYAAMWEQKIQKWKEELSREALQAGLLAGEEKGQARGRKQGLKEGLERGLEQGQKQGQENLLLRQLERKFGPLDSKTRTRVRRADADRLLEWGERILTADRLEQVFAE